MLRVQDLKFERGDDVLFAGVNLVVYPPVKEWPWWVATAWASLLSLTWC